jgi:hypothetical protein
MNRADRELRTANRREHKENVACGGRPHQVGQRPPPKYDHAERPRNPHAPTLDVVPSVRASQVCRDQSGTLKWDRFFKGVPGFEEEKPRYA